MVKVLNPSLDAFSQTTDHDDHYPILPWLPKRQLVLPWRFSSPPASLWSHDAKACGPQGPVLPVLGLWSANCFLKFFFGIPQKTWLWHVMTCHEIIFRSKRRNGSFVGTRHWPTDFQDINGLIWFTSPTVATPHQLFNDVQGICGRWGSPSWLRMHWERWWTMMNDENISNFVSRCGTSGPWKTTRVRSPTLHHRQDQTLLSALGPWGRLNLGDDWISLLSLIESWYIKMSISLNSVSQRCHGETGGQPGPELCPGVLIQPSEIPSQINQNCNQIFNHWCISKLTRPLFEFRMVCPRNAYPKPGYPKPGCFSHLL